jgi:hypothetical protein
MLSSQLDQEDRKRVLDNDRRVREQTGTFMSHTHSEMGGRFTEVGAAHIVGSTALPNYPAAAAHQADPCGLESALGYRIDALEPLNPRPDGQGNSGDADVPSPLADDVEPASSFSHGDPAPEVQLPASVSANAGPPPVRNLRRF